MEGQVKVLSRGYLHGLVLGIVTVVGCASAGFPYHYYNAQMKDECYDTGRLLGKLGSDGWPDISLNQCKPDPSPSPGASPGPKPNLFKCVTLIRDDWDSLKADDLKCHQDLQICQRGPEPKP